LKQNKLEAFEKIAKSAAIAIAVVIFAALVSASAFGLDAMKNGAKSYLSVGINSTDTSLTVQTGDGAKFPAAPFNLIISDASLYSFAFDDPNVEVVRVTAKSTDTFTITRGVESTSAHTHNAGGHSYLVYSTVTADWLNNQLTAYIGGASTTGNAGTATAAQSTPTTCGSTLFSKGVNSAWNAQCTQPQVSDLSDASNVAKIASANSFSAKQAITSTASSGTDEPSQTNTFTSSNLNGTQEGAFKGTCDFTNAANGASYCTASYITVGNGGGSGPAAALFGQVTQNTASANHQFQGVVGVANTSNSSNATARMVGVIGRGGDAGSGNDGVHVGVIGYAKRASSSTNGAGVYAKIATATAAFAASQSEVDPGTSSAVVANNGDTALPEYIGQNNGTKNWQIGATGDVTGGSVKTLTESSATAFVALNIPNSEGCSAKIVYTILAKDATNTQLLAGDLYVAAVANSTGTVTAATISDQHTLNPVSSGTLTNTMTQTTAANTITLLSNAVSSLTQTTLEIRYRVESRGGNCSTITAQ
jgi:hypothetical protein